MQDSATDLIHTSEPRPYEDPQVAQIKTIKAHLERSYVSSYVDICPEGVQFDIYGPVIRRKGHLPEGQLLGVLNIEGLGTDSIILDYHSTSGGKAFKIIIGADVKLDRDISMGEIAELLSPLFANVDEHGFIESDPKGIHLGGAKNLQYFDRLTGQRKLAIPSGSQSQPILQIKPGIPQVSKA